jgi:protein-S-isoprenylcysteine O-methyltransferase Ste14
VRLTVRSTSTRTFIVVPVVVAAEQLVRRRPLRPAWSPLLVAGYLGYRSAGAYRLGRAGGPPGMSQGVPDRLTTTGPYAVTRNPMYLGHLVFLTGLTMVTRSPVAAVVAAAHVPWFSARVRRDELRLRARFGAPYDEYCARVPRWVPGLTARHALAPGTSGS